MEVSNGRRTYICPYQCRTMLKQCSCMTSASSGAVHVVLVTHAGISLYHTQFCPATQIGSINSIQERDNTTSHELATLPSEGDDQVPLIPHEHARLRLSVVLPSEDRGLVCKSSENRDVRTHFMTLAGVIWPNMAKPSRIAT